MAVTQVVATLAPLPLPRPLATQVVGQVVGNLSQSLAGSLSPRMRRKLARGEALSEKELSEVADAMAAATDVPLLDSGTARPIFRAAADALFGPERVQVRAVRVDWGEVLTAGIGLEDEGYRAELAVKMAGAVDVPGLSEEQEQRVARWILDRAVEVAPQVLPPQLLQVLRASSTEDLEALRPTLAQALVDRMQRSALIAGATVMVPEETKRRGADLVVDWIYKNWVQDSSARISLMSPAERRSYEHESLRRRVRRLEAAQANLSLQTQLALAQLWDNHWERLRLVWLLRAAAAWRLLVRLGVCAGCLAAAAAACYAAGRPDLVAASVNWLLLTSAAAAGFLSGTAWPACKAAAAAAAAAFAQAVSWTVAAVAALPL